MCTTEDLYDNLKVGVMRRKKSTEFHLQILLDFLLYQQTFLHCLMMLLYTSFV